MQDCLQRWLAHEAWRDLGPRSLHDNLLLRGYAAPWQFVLTPRRHFSFRHLTNKFKQQR